MTILNEAEKREVEGWIATLAKQAKMSPVERMYARHGRTAPTVAEAAAWSPEAALLTFYLQTEAGFRNIFVGYILGNRPRTVSLAENITPTAHIDTSGTIVYGARFMAGLPIKQQRYVMVHEVSHWALRHFTRSRTLLRTKYSVDNIYKIDPWVLAVELDLLNLAEDCAINQMLDGRESEGFERPFGPKFGVSLESLQKRFGISLDPGQAYERYYWQIANSPKGAAALRGATEPAKEIHDDIEADGIGHARPEDEGEAEDGLEDIAAESIITTAADKQAQDSALQGKGSGWMDAIGRMLPKHDRKLKDRDLWRSVVLTALGSCRSQDRRRTLRRPDRRDHTNPFGRENPMQGSRSVVILDTSGSCLADIPDFLGVVERAVRWYGAVVDIMLVGDDVYAIHKNVARLNPGSLELKTGGTDLTAAQKIIARDYPQRTTNVVVLTDGETAWLEDWGFRTSAVYTHGHRKLPGVTKFAVLQPKSDDCEERL